jgi:ectoine hydroxylase
VNETCLEHRLTDAERKSFEETGLLVIPGALAPDLVETLRTHTDITHAAQVEKGFNPNEALFYPNFIPDADCFANLVDYERILPKVWGILGWNIYLYHAHMIVTPPSGKSPDNKTFGWHQDSGRANRDIETHPRPRLSLKVAYFLSDASEPGRGNFWVVPGSHLSDTLEVPSGEGQPKGACPVLVNPGDAVLFDRRIWHAGSPNWSEVTRKVLFYGYGYRWIRTKDDMTVGSLWEQSDPIRRQLLGFGTNCNGFYSPSDEDVPLRTWLQAHSPSEALG